MKAKIVTLIILSLITLSCSQKYSFKQAKYDPEKNSYSNFRSNYVINLNANCQVHSVNELPNSHEILPTLTRYKMESESTVLRDNSKNITLIYTVKKDDMSKGDWAGVLATLILADEKKERELGNMLKNHYNLDSIPSEYQIHGRFLVAVFPQKEGTSLKFATVMQAFADQKEARKGNFLFGLLTIPPTLTTKGKNSELRTFLNQFELTTFELADRTINNAK